MEVGPAAGVTPGVWAPLACGVTYCSQCGLCSTHWGLSPSHMGRNSACLENELLAPAAGARRWITACVAGAGCWEASVCFLPQIMHVGCEYSLANLTEDQPVSREPVRQERRQSRHSLLEGQRGRAGNWGNNEHTSESRVVHMCL